MSIQENKEFAKTYFSANADAVRADFASGGLVNHDPELRVHTPMGDWDFQTYMGFMNTLIEAFPDCQYHAEDVIAEGDKVVVRYTMTGTQQGDFQGIPPTGKPVKIEGIGIVRIGGGRMQEFWFASDMLGMMQQLGAIPS